VASALFGLAQGRRGSTPKLIPAALKREIDDYQATPLRWYEELPFWPLIRELSSRLSTYDAAYVALAEALGIPLVTSDAKIAKIDATHCRVETFTINSAT